MTKNFAKLCAYVLSTVAMILISVIATSLKFYTGLHLSPWNQGLPPGIHHNKPGCQLQLRYHEAGKDLTARFITNKMDIVNLCECLILPDLPFYQVLWCSELTKDVLGVYVISLQKKNFKKTSKKQNTSYDTADCDFQPPESCLSIIYLFMCKVPYQNILLLSIIMIFKRTLQAIRLHRNMMLSVVHDFSQLKSISHLQIS